MLPAARWDWWVSFAFDFPHDLCNLCPSNKFTRSMQEDIYRRRPASSSATGDVGVFGCPGESTHHKYEI
jgi:hypothetical protein